MRVPPTRVEGTWAWKGYDRVEKAVSTYNNSVFAGVPCSSHHLFVSGKAGSQAWSRASRIPVLLGRRRLMMRGLRGR